MNESIRYILEVIVCSGIFTGLYACLLERRVHFSWCRAYLLATMLLSMLIPALRIPVWPGRTIHLPSSVGIGEITARVIPDATQPISSATLLMLLSALGSVVLLALIGRQIIRIRRLYQGASVATSEGIRVVSTPRAITSFSFLGTIYLWAGTDPGTRTAILAHETSHIVHRHSAERIAMEFLKALQWWNPFAWFASRRLTEVHEFEADHDVLRAGYDTRTYMQILLRQTLGYCPEIANGLHNSLTKKRFKMMTTHSTGRYTLLRLAATLPAVIGLLCAFSFTSRAAVVLISQPSPTPAIAEATAPATSASVATSAPAEAPAAPSAQQPTAAKTATCEVTLSIFIQSGHGDTQPAVGAVVKVAGGTTGAVADKEGHVKLEVPQGSTLNIIMVDTESQSIVVPAEKTYGQMVVLKTADAQSNTPPTSLTTRATNPAGNPLFVVDGKVLPSDLMKTIDPSCIESITVLKDKSAIDLYGQAAADGVILITTKTGGITLTNKSQKPEQPTGDAANAANSGPDEAFLVVENMPVFQNGNLSDFRNWIQSQVKFPIEALNKNIQGRVVASFVIGKDGSVGDIQILESPDKTLSDEVIRAIGASPRWTPGTQRGKTVRVKYTVPVDFKATSAKTEGK